MQISANPKELSNAVNAITALKKKMPSEISRNDASMALLCNKDSTFSMVASFDWFSVSVPIPSAVVIGKADALFPWTGGRLTSSNLIGIVGAEELGKLLSKLDNKKDNIIIDYKKDANYFEIAVDDTGEYRFSAANPQKVLSNYARSKIQREAFSLTGAEIDSTISLIGAIADAISMSVSKPGFGCVCISSETVADKSKIRFSGSSDVEGFSIIFNSSIDAKSEFTALLPKKLGEGLKTFFKCFGAEPPSITVGGTFGDDGRAKNLTFDCEAFSLTLACMSDDFPFRSVDGLVNSVKNPPASVKANMGRLKKTLRRISTVAQSKDAITAIGFSDGGTFKTAQYDHGDIHAKVAQEIFDTDEIVAFPDDKADVYTVVKTSILKKLIGFYSQNDAFVSITLGRNGANGKLVLSDSTDFDTAIVCILLGVKTR